MSEELDGKWSFPSHIAFEKTICHL